MENDKEAPLEQQGSPTALPQGIIEDPRQAFWHLPLTAIAPIVSAIAASPGGAKQLRELLAKEDPLGVFIEDSFQQNQSHKVTLKIVNQSLHGIYLESVALERPTRFSCNLHILWDSGGGIRTPGEHIPNLPLLLPSNDDVYFDLTLKLFDEAEFKKAPYGVLSRPIQSLMRRIQPLNKFSFGYALSMMARALLSVRLRTNSAMTPSTCTATTAWTCSLIYSGNGALCAMGPHRSQRADPLSPLPYPTGSAGRTRQPAQCQRAPRVCRNKSAC